MACRLEPSPMTFQNVHCSMLLDSTNLPPATSLNNPPPPSGNATLQFTTGSVTVKPFIKQRQAPPHLIPTAAPVVTTSSLGGTQPQLIPTTSCTYSCPAAHSTGRTQFRSKFRSVFGPVSRCSVQRYHRSLYAVYPSYSRRRFTI